LDCHDGECLPCDEDSFVHRKCRCLKSKVKISCIDLVEQNGLVLCHRACKKMNSCNNPRHRCKNVCCTENHDAQCLIPCGAKLSCKEHFCPEGCHFGRSCLPCMNITWTELSCRCGSQKLLPPIACGADTMISCNVVCPEKRDCGHASNHKCHDLRSDCAPCVEFVEKPCVCGKVGSVKTHCWKKDKNVSCGQICGIKMECGHTCNKPCHDHENETVKCSLPCIKPRPDCKHECGKTCHFPEPCLHEEVYCSKRVKVFCQCGFVSRVLDCGAPEWKTNQASIFAKRETYYKLVKARSMRNERFDESKKMAVLQCDDSCLKHTRNEALRQALEIPDARSKVEYDTWRQEYHNNLCYD
jgi:transcriptional repressor NF-X1